MGRNDEADTRTSIEIASGTQRNTVAGGEDVDAANTRRRIGELAFGTDHKAAKLDIVTDGAAVEQTVGGSVGIFACAKAIIAQQAFDARAGEGGLLLCQCRGGNRSEGKSDNKGTHKQLLLIPDMGTDAQVGGPDVCCMNLS